MPNLLVAKKKWFTVDEAATLLGFSPIRVYRLVSKKLLAAENFAPPHRKKRELRISRETLQKALRQQREGRPVCVI